MDCQSSIMAAVAFDAMMLDRLKQLINTLNQHVTLHPPARRQAFAESGRLAMR
jgi:hypothetical protein